VQTGQVERVIDGDTIDVRIGDETYRVRYIGMDTPEVGDPFAREATELNRELVQGQTATLVKDVSETDRYGRLLRYVFVGDTFVNYELVAQGLAMASTYPPDVACAQTFVEAQREAVAAGVGLWAAGEGSAAPPPADGCDPSYPTICIPSPPPDLDCRDIPYRRFRVLPPDPHNFDGDHDGIGCEGA
jgi:micrococcal nuclease